MGAIDYTERFADHNRRSHCADKRRPDGAPSELGKAALIQSGSSKFLVGRTVGSSDAVRFHWVPHVLRLAPAWKHVRSEPKKIVDPTSQACFDHLGKTHIIKRAARRLVVYPAERQAWIFVMHAETPIEFTFDYCRPEPALFGPARHGSRFPHPDQFEARQQRGAVVRESKDIAILKDQLHLARCRIKAASPVSRDRPSRGSPVRSTKGRTVACR